MHKYSNQGKSYLLTQRQIDRGRSIWELCAVYEKIVWVNFLKSSFQMATRCCYRVYTSPISHTVCHFAQSVTLHSLSLCTVCHFAQSVTLHSLSLCTVCHFAQSATLRSLSLCAVCHFAQSVTLRSLSLCAVCHFAQSVTLHSLSFTHSHLLPVKQCYYLLSLWAVTEE